MRRMATALVLLWPVVVLGSALDVDTGTYGQMPPNVSWWGAAVYTNDQGELGIGVPMGASVALWMVGGYEVASAGDTVYGGSWSYSSNVDGEWVTCYATSVAAQTFDKYASKYGNSTCNGAPPPPPPPPYPTAENQNDGCPSPTDPYCGTSPVVLNFGNGGYRFTGLEDPVAFDLRAEGSRRLFGWTVAETDQAFLVIDRNGNGRVDDGSELFGNYTRLPDGTRAANGFTALDVFDQNRDRVIDPADSVWSTLRLWFDRNHNGLTDPGEIIALPRAGVTWLGLEAHWTGRRDTGGNLLKFEAMFGSANRARPYYDVYLVSGP